MQVRVTLLPDTSVLLTGSARQASRTKGCIVHHRPFMVTAGCSCSLLVGGVYRLTFVAQPQGHRPKHTTAAQARLLEHFSTSHPSSIQYSVLTPHYPYHACRRGPPSGMEGSMPSHAIPTVCCRKQARLQPCQHSAQPG